VKEQHIEKLQFKFFPPVYFTWH